MSGMSTSKTFDYSTSFCDLCQVVETRFIVWRRHISSRQCEFCVEEKLGFLVKVTYLIRLQGNVLLTILSIRMLKMLLHILSSSSSVQFSGA